MSLKYTELVGQVENANKVIKELTPLEGGVQDSEALEGWMRMQNGKVDMVTEELKRLQSKLTRTSVRCCQADMQCKNPVWKNCEIRTV